MPMNKEIRTSSGQWKLYQNVLETIGNTPVIKLDKFSHNNTSIYVKAEFFNPAGSVKDRLAINIIEDAEREGLLKPGQTVIEATSGNTGVGLAMVCAQKGYPLVIVMAESFSIERRKLMRMYGAKVILTPKEEKGLGMYKKAIELGGAEITLQPNNKKMFLSVDQLKQGLQKPTSKEFNPNPRLNETKPFRLCNFYWQEQNENQLELIWVRK